MNNQSRILRILIINLIMFSTTPQTKLALHNTSERHTRTDFHADARI
jgi:hypothetical protein